MTNQPQNKPALEDVLDEFIPIPDSIEGISTAFVREMARDMILTLFQYVAKSYKEINDKYNLCTRNLEGRAAYNSLYLLVGQILRKQACKDAPDEDTMEFTRVLLRTYEHGAQASVVEPKHYGPCTEPLTYFFRKTPPGIVETPENTPKFRAVEREDVLEQHEKSLRGFRDTCIKDNGSENDPGLYVYRTLASYHDHMYYNKQFESEVVKIGLDPKSLECKEAWHIIGTVLATQMNLVGNVCLKSYDLKRPYLVL